MSHTGPTTISNNPIHSSSSPTYSTTSSTNAGAHAQDASHHAHQAASDLKASANDATYRAQTTAQDASSRAQATAQDASSRAQATAQDASARAKETAANAQNQAQAKLREANATLHNLADQAAQHPIVQSGREQAQVQLNALDRQLARFGFLNDLEARTNIPKTYGVIGFGAVFSLLILLNLFGLAQPITNLIGWALPAYLTIHALESPQKGDDAQWLCYWIVFGFLNYIESAALRVVLYYIPHYFTIKLFATLYLMLPQFRGAEKVYYSALRPLFHQSKAKASQLNNTLNQQSRSSNYSSFPNSGLGSSNLGSQSGLGQSGFTSGSTSSSGLVNDSTAYSTGINTHPSSHINTSTAGGSHNPFVATSGGSSGITGNVGGLPPAAGVPLPESAGRL